MARTSGKKASSSAPPLPYGRRPVLTFVWAAVLPAVFVLLVGIVLQMNLLGQMAGEIDRLEGDRNAAAVHAELASFIDGLTDLTANAGTSDEAYHSVVAGLDAAWMDGVWGAAARSGTSYSTAIVTDQAGNILFGENGVGALTGKVAEIIPGAEAMLTELDTGIEATGDATMVSHFAKVGDQVLGVSVISIHRTTGGGVTIPRQVRRVLWLARPLTPEMLQAFSDRFMSPLARLADTPAADGSEIELLTADGTVAGVVTWTSERPGEQALSHVQTIVLITYGAIAFALGLALWGIYSAMRHRIRALEAVGAAAQAAPVVEAVENYVPAAAQQAAPDEPADTLLDGVAAGKFEIAYQPIFDLRAETIVGVEGRLRWRKGDGSELLEEDLASRHHALLLNRAGMLAIRRAAEDMAPLPGISLTMNVTPVQLADGVFGEKIIASLRAIGFSPQRMQLCVDIATLPPVANLQSAIGDLRRQGMIIVLGNFTVDAQAIGYLDAGLVDRIRLAPSLLAGMDASASRQAYVAAAMEIARAAEISATVTGAEDRDIVARLLRLGCREFQGNLFAAPMAAAAMTQLVMAPAEAKRAG